MQFGKFGVRLGAVLIDCIILLPWTGMFIFYNAIYWKFFPLFLLGQFLLIIYKVYSEYKYGHTIGKWILNLHCVNNEIKNLSLKQAVIRNINIIIPALINIPTYYLLFASPEFAEVDSIMKYMDALRKFNLPPVIGIGISVIMLVDVLFIFTDNKSRALHDKLAGSLVIVNQKEIDKEVIVIKHS